MTRRGTSNRDVRGNSRDRARRRAWLLKTYASDVPGYCRCYRCGRLLTESAITVDRIIPGCEGGTYARNNIRPACAKCNQLTGSALGNARLGNSWQAGEVRAACLGLDFNQLAREIAAARVRRTCRP